jgi:hypothetical protein
MLIDLSIAISNPIVSYHFGRAIAQAVFPPRRSAFEPSQVMLDLCWINWNQNRFSPSASVSPANSIIRDWYNRSISGRRTKLTQSRPIQ